MKRLIVFSMFLALGIMLVSGISPYLLVAEYEGPIDNAVAKVQAVLEEKGYDIIGRYQPGDNPNLYVMAFTSKDIIAQCQKSEDRGLLAAAMKVGFQKKEGKVFVSIVNPEYLFYAYFRDKMNEPSFKSSALRIAEGVKSSMQQAGTEMQTFGGDLSEKELLKYRYMVGMPDFDKAVELTEVNSFNQGLEAIRKGLSRSENTIKVYEIISQNKEIAVFGVGLKDKKEGEAYFLPIIGESHVAAMPYELILQGNEITMLHGRYRFALHWPELTMKTFTKIMSSPGDVEDAMKSLFEAD